MTTALLTPPASTSLTVRSVVEPQNWDSFLKPHGYAGFPLRAEWLAIFRDAFGHEPHFLEARENDRLVGVLPLAFVESRLFGRYLVSLPYLNTGGVLADSNEAARQLIDAAVQLADERNVKHLELRHERPVDHPALNAAMTSKVHLRLPLPKSADELFASFRSKLRSQIKKPLANAGFTVEWGRSERLNDFYNVFCTNMRDLGTPPYGRRLFESLLLHFPHDAELCVLKHEGRPVSAALLIHSEGVTQVPSASTIRAANKLAANMLLYWRLLERAVERGQRTFDFGRSTLGAGTYEFKKQWGAEDHPAHWQYYVRQGSAGDLRPDNPRYQRLIELWKKLPVPVTRWLGPSIVRGIP